MLSSFSLTNSILDRIGSLNFWKFSEKFATVGHLVIWEPWSAADLMQFLKCQHPWLCILRKPTPSFNKRVINPLKISKQFLIDIFVKFSEKYQTVGHLIVWKIWLAASHITRAYN